jgi:hypothetical protein
MMTDPLSRYDPFDLSPYGDDDTIPELEDPQIFLHYRELFEEDRDTLTFNMVMP